VPANDWRIASGGISAVGSAPGVTQRSTFSPPTHFSRPFPWAITSSSPCLPLPMGGGMGPFCGHSSLKSH